MRNFGDLLVNLRTKNDITKKDLAALIGYTPKQLYRIEKNECIPSTDLLIKLSEFYKIDLLQYYKILINDVSFDSFIQFSELRNAIEKADYPLVKKLYKEYENLPSFSTEEGIRLIYYAKALCYLNEKKYNESLEYCIHGLEHKSIDDFFNELTLEKIYSNTTYNLIFCVGYNFYFLNKMEEYEAIVLILYKNINKHFFGESYIEYLNSKFIIRFYSVILNNLADLNIQKQEYSLALDFIEKAIKYSTGGGNGLGLLDTFYFTKFQCYYNLGLLKEASMALDYCLTLSMIFDKENDTRRRIKSLKDNYPSILEYVKVDELLQKYNLHSDNN